LYAGVVRHADYEGLPMSRIKALTNGGMELGSDGDIVLRIKQEYGFSLIEMGIVLMLACALAGLALINAQATMPGMHANTAMYQTIAQLRRGRQTAIAQRRSVQLNIGERNRIQLVRNDFPEGETVLSTAAFSNNCACLQFPEVTEDTPDRFGNAAPVDFGGAAGLTFLPDGTLVDDSGNPVSGTIFIGLPDHPETARAVTVLGATGRIRGYRWTGTEWIQ
jgi:Tfp pilus assembly protein FimT